MSIAPDASASYPTQTTQRRREHHEAYLEFRYENPSSSGGGPTIRSSVWLRYRRIWVVYFRITMQRPKPRSTALRFRMMASSIS